MKCFISIGYHQYCDNPDCRQSIQAFSAPTLGQVFICPACGTKNTVDSITHNPLQPKCKDDEHKSIQNPEGRDVAEIAWLRRKQEMSLPTEDMFNEVWLREAVRLEEESGCDVEAGVSMTAEQIVLERLKSGPVDVVTLSKILSAFGFPQRTAKERAWDLVERGIARFNKDWTLEMTKTN